jgi:maltooligosyltrehalose trehalohydrolase
MLWMGQEWAASSPFQYFTDHPEELGRLVTEGRREEFKHFSAFADESVRERIPDPQAEKTFLDSKLRWDEREHMPHRGLLDLHRDLLRLRRDEAAMQGAERDGFAIEAIGERTLALRRSALSGDTMLAVIHLGDATTLRLDAIEATPRESNEHWTPVLSTEDARYGGSGSGAVIGRDGATLTLSGPGAVILRGRR